MDTFFFFFAPLANKNNPIIIDIGCRIDDSRFNVKLSKDNIENILTYVKNSPEYKIKINNIKGISEFYHGNYYFKHMKNNTEFCIINTNDKFINNNIVIRSLDVKKDTFIPPSVSKYNSVANYDLLTVTINNCIDICIYDCIEYFKCQLVIKKPVAISTIKAIINNISIN